MNSSAPARRPDAVAAWDTADGPSRLPWAVRGLKSKAGFILILTVSVLFPAITPTQIMLIAGGCGLAGLAAVGYLLTRRRPAPVPIDRRGQENWRMPPMALLGKAEFSTGRKIGHGSAAGAGLWSDGGRRLLIMADDIRSALCSSTISTMVDEPSC